MAVNRAIVVEEEFPEWETRIPSPMPDGIEYVESLGRWVDNLFGDRRAQRAADRFIAQLVGPEDEPDEPELIEPPEPLSDGTEDLTRGGEPDQKK